MLIVDIGGHADDAHGRGAHADELSTGSVQMTWRLSASWLGNMRRARLWLMIDTGSLAFAVEIVEIAAGDHGDAERGEKSRRDDAELAARIVFAGARTCLRP